MTADEPMTEIKKSGFWDRAIRNLRGAWEKIASDGDSFTVGSLSPDLSDNDRERLVVYASFSLGLKPRELCAQYGDQFANVRDVYRIKQNVLERLRRDPELKTILGEYA